MIAKSIACISWLGLAVLAGCSNVGEALDIKGNLLIPENKFSYQIAVVSKQQPKSWSVFSPKEAPHNVLKRRLLEKKFDIAGNPISIKESKSIVAGKILLIECIGSPLKGRVKQEYRFSQGYACSAFDLFDGKKVYEGEAYLNPNLSTNYESMMFEAFRLSLMNLPNSITGQGRRLHEAELFNEIVAR